VIIGCANQENAVGTLFQIPVFIKPGCKQFADTPIPFNRRASSNVKTMFASFDVLYLYPGIIDVSLMLFRFKRAIVCAIDATITIRLGLDRFNKSVSKNYFLFILFEDSRDNYEN